MKKMGRYCKAYPITKLRQFDMWVENLQNIRKEIKLVDGKEIEVTRELKDEDFLYIQDNYTVTDGIFLDENVIYDKVSPGWISYCKDVLKFEIPNYEAIATNASEEDSRQKTALADLRRGI